MKTISIFMFSRNWIANYVRPIKIYKRKILK